MQERITSRRRGPTVADLPHSSLSRWLKLGRVLIPLLTLAVGAWAVSWTHDLAIGTFDIQYPGAGASAGSQAFEIPPGQPATVRVEVRNQSPNGSMPYQLTVRAGDHPVGVAVGRSLPANRSRMHTFNWVAVPGSYLMSAELRLTKKPPGGDPDQVCLECRRQGCGWPQSCSLGSARQVCGCHTPTDNENNNRAVIQVVAGGYTTPTPTPPPTGPADLVVESVTSTPSHKGMGSALVTVYIANHGGQDVRGNIKVAVTVQGLRVASSLTGGLRAGQTRQVHLEFHKGGPASVVVDPENHVKEADESNNEGSGFVDLPYRERVPSGRP